MLKRLPLLLLLTLCCLTAFPQAGIPEELRLPPGKTSLAPEVLAKLGAQFPEKPSLPTDLEAITSSYPGFCLGVEVRDRKVYLIMKNGPKLLYDDGLVKSFADKLQRPDLEDMLAQVYRPGRVQEPFRPDYDPGRFRVDGLFSAVYGSSSSEVGGHLVPVDFCGARVRFNAQNGAAAALKSVGRELAALVAKRPQLRQYLLPLGGTFAWRPIAGTNRLSPHSWGIAIDLNPRHGAYWRDRKMTGPEVEAMRHSYPQEIVEIFEKHGFIWGGKWSHFDLMHFEYRPEMVKKWQLSRGAGRVDEADSAPGPQR
jgi:D-alanyl-D-alanine carboxypeptidase